MLVVDEDITVSKMLRFYFGSLGYEVLAADHRSDALSICRTRLFNVILVAAQMRGAHDFLDILRSSDRTKYIPVIYLIPENTQNVEHSRPGSCPDDYVAKPFAVEDLRQRVETARRRRSQKGLTHPVTGLPTGSLVQERLSQLDGAGKTWGALWFRLGGEASIDVNQVVLCLADIVWETIAALSAPGDFIGQLPAPGNDIVVVTSPDVAPQIHQTVMRKFHREVWGEIELYCERWYL